MSPVCLSILLKLNPCSYAWLVAIIVLWVNFYIFGSFGAWIWKLLASLLWLTMYKKLDFGYLIYIFPVHLSIISLPLLRLFMLFLTVHTHIHFIIVLVVIKIFRNLKLFISFIFHVYAPSISAPIPSYVHVPTFSWINENGSYIGFVCMYVFMYMGVYIRRRMKKCAPAHLCI